MRHSFRWAGLLFLILAFVLPVSGADEKKDTKNTVKKADVPEVKEKEDWVVVGQYVGTITNVQAAQKAFSLQVTNKVAVPNQAAINKIAELQRSMAVSRDPNAIASYRLQIAQQQQQTVTYKDKNQEHNLVAHEDVKVRVSEPPVEFNDKGDRKKYTKEELRKLAGPGNLWGFPAEFDQMSKGSLVRAIVSKKKTAMKGKKKGDDDGDNQPVVTQIHIYPAPMNTAPAKK